jgi:hypothetical protein
MAEKLSFALDKLYKLKNDGSDIVLDVIFGDIGQSPDTTVKLNTKELLSEFKQSVNGLLIGKDEDLKGKVLRVTGNVADISKKTNKISLDFMVNGGVKELGKKFSVTVADEGEIVIFSLVIRFVA